MGFGNQTIQIHPAQIVLGYHYNMIYLRVFPDQFRCGSRNPIHILQGIDLALFEFFYELNKNAGCTLGIIHCTMVIVQRNSQFLRHMVKGCFLAVGKEKPRHTHGTEPADIFKGNMEILCIFQYKIHIKGCVVTNQGSPFTELQKFGKHFFYAVCILHHRIIDSRQFFNFKADGFMGVYKGRKTVNYHSFFHFYSTDFDNLMYIIVQTGGFQIKYNKGII